jgi:hypothetical protein
MSGKIRVEDVYQKIYPYDGIQNIINVLLGAQAAEASGKWTDLQLSHPYTDSNGFSTSEWHIIGERWETDKEYDKRMKDLEKAKVLADKQKEKQKVDERKLYEKLRKKYGDK